MVIAAIILGIVALVCLVIAIVTYINDYDSDTAGGFIVLFLIFGVLWLVTFLMCLRWQAGTQQLTGYIYSSEDAFGYTTGHLRFSENAGADEQPSFCSKSDSKPGTQIREYAGTGKKVKVTIPPYFYFANNPFVCGTTGTTIEEVN